MLLKILKFRNCRRLPPSGEYAIIAEGCVVKMNQVIPAGVVAAGNPAKVVRDVSPKDRELWEYGKQLYIDLAKTYLEKGMEPVRAR